jgi:hypothetical protein
MADIAQMLMLPAPTHSYALTQRYRDGVSDQPDSATDRNTRQNGQAAHRFRFRVYENGNAEAPATESDAPGVARQNRLRLVDGAFANATNTRDNARADKIARADARTGGDNRTVNHAFAAVSSAFLTQAIAQEQLREGLHNPPVAAANAAYARANATLAASTSSGLDISA